MELAAEALCDDGSSGGIETRQQIKNMEKLKQSREWEEINFEGEEEEVERSKWEFFLELKVSELKGSCQRRA